MKKLFSIIALFAFSSGVILAQNTGTINQTGDDHEAIIEQTGQNNEAEIIQEHDRNSAEIVQVNDNNKVVIDQIYGSDNVAQVKQMGDQQQTFFRQNGNENVFRLRQEGGFNEVGLDADNPFMQNGDGNKFAGASYHATGLFFEEENYAIQYKGSALDSESIQDGHHNTIGLYQEESWAKIQQFGDYNEVLLKQGPSGNIATIIQDGNGNSASVRQWP